jgi:hypothetical protein
MSDSTAKVKGAVVNKNLFRSIIILAAIIASPALLLSGNTPSLSPGSAYAQDDWRKEFDDICAKTQDADEFSIKELKDIIDRCDALKPSIEKIQESQGKVALKRLKMCRDLYVFVLQAKENH